MTRTRKHKYDKFEIIIYDGNYILLLYICEGEIHVIENLDGVRESKFDLLSHFLKNVLTEFKNFEVSHKKYQYNFLYTPISPIPQRDCVH